MKWPLWTYYKKTERLRVLDKVRALASKHGWSSAGRIFFPLEFLSGGGGGGAGSVMMGGKFSGGVNVEIGGSGGAGVYTLMNRSN